MDYQPLPSDLPVTLIKATGGFPQVMQPGREVYSYTDAPLHGWEYLNLPKLRVIEVPGDHFTVFSKHLDMLAAALRSCLAESPRSGSSETSRSDPHRAGTVAGGPQLATDLVGHQTAE